MIGGDPWSMVVTLSGPATIDVDEVRRALEVLLVPDGAHELRGLPSGRSRIVYASDIDAALKAVQTLADDRGVYYTLNPVRSDLGDRAAKVGDIVSRRWILIDCDRRKKVEPDAMATLEEKASAMELARHTADWLLEQGWPLPVMIDSGNGQHLLYRIDLPSNDIVRKLLKRFLKSLATRFDDDQATIDSSVHNASRIAKLPGTWVRKEANAAERSWRIARLMFVPDSIGIVTAEQIEAIAGAAPDDERHIIPMVSPDPWEMVVSSGAPDRVSAYCRSAMDKEVVKVLLAMPGSRNETLNAAAFALGQFVGASLLDRSEVIRQLEKAAHGCGLGETETRKTIESGLESGISQPRTIPDSVRNAEQNGQAAQSRKVIDPTKPFIVWAKNITKRKVEWLWPNRIPVGKQTTFAGQTGMGKTFTVCDIAARVTNGDEIPFGKGQCFEQGKVLMISAEDDADDTIVPRFEELGGDTSRLAFLAPECESQFSLAALDILNKSLDQMGEDVRMVAIDPPTSFLGRVDDHKNAELRGLLAPLRLWTIQRRVSLIMVTHINKGGSGNNIDAMARVMGSAAWVQAVRAAHMFCADPDNKNRVLFMPLKINNAKKPKGLSYQIEETREDLAVIRWLGEVEISADEAMNKEMKKPRSKDASEWLIDMFTRRQEWPSDLFWAELKAAGITQYAFNQIREKMLIPKAQRVAQPSGDVTYLWRVPPNWPYFANQK
jgi:hypothetical protein